MTHVPSKLSVKAPMLTVVTPAAAEDPLTPPKIAIQSVDVTPVHVT